MQTAECSRRNAWQPNLDLEAEQLRGSVIANGKSSRSSSAAASRQALLRGKSSELGDDHPPNRQGRSSHPPAADIWGRYV